MKNLVKRSVSVMMVVVCLMTSAVFADTNDFGTQEIIELEVCKAVDTLGGIPDYIQGPDREDLEVMLENIDEYNSVGLYDQANLIWESVYELIAPYQEQFGENNETESKSDEELIQEQIQKFEERIMRYENNGDFTSADELRAELEKLLIAVYGEENHDMGNDDEDEIPENGFSEADMERIIEEVEIEIKRLEEAGDFEAAEALRNELEGFLNQNFGDDHEQPHEGFINELTPEELKTIIEELEREIEHLERVGDFETAEMLRNDLEALLNEYFGEHQEEPSEGFDNELTPEDMKMMIEELEAEIEYLERVGDFEAAEMVRNELEALLNGCFGEYQEEQFEGFDYELTPDDVKMMIEELEAEIKHLEMVGDFEAAENLRRELEEFINEHNCEFHEEPEEENYFDKGFLSLEEILNRAGHDLSPGQLAIISYLVNEINEVISE